MEQANAIEIPSYFLCPISLQLMRDPVTVSTGITYDRENIEKWFFSCKETTCPVTKEPLQDKYLTPNHTLRRLIQAWCTLNSSHGFERIPTPKPSTDKSQILKLLAEAQKSPETQFNCLRRLRSIAHRNESSKKVLEAVGPVEFLVSIVKIKEIANDEDPEVKASDDALDLLSHLDISDSDLKKFIMDDAEFLESLMHVLRYGYFQSRAYAIMILRSAFNVADPVQLIEAKPEIFVEILQILQDKISDQASKAALKLLIELCQWGKNRIKAVQSGLVFGLVELLIETHERRVCELALTTLDQLCSCAEGRAELLKHGAGLAIVSNKVLRVSHSASDKAVRVLVSVSKFSANSRVLQEMLQVGVVAKLCLVLQVDCSRKTKERSKEILRLHSRVWRESPCIPPHLLSSYPSF